MLLTINTESLRGYGLNRIFAFVKRLGFDGVDLAIDPKNYDTQDSNYVKSLIDQYHLPVIALQTPERTTQKKVLEAVEMAKKLGVKIIIVQPPKILDFKYTSWLKKEIPKIREKENISIALENAPSGTFLGFLPEHAMSSLNELKKFKHACLDTSRVAEKKEDLIRVYNALRKYLVHIHLSNVHHGKPYSPVDEGILPLESFLSKLKQDHFKGAVSLKISPKFIHAGEDEKMLEALKHSQEFCLKYLEK